ncbi:MAG TPA: methionine--tRNA ligase [Candidatus Nanoarchaeia archaeon]|nr:methionine--tRNA ligase [Candidatus Nanoarchaeia archaeon]
MSKIKPKKGQEKKTPKQIIVTSALPYANGPIHIGHMLEYIQTDIYVRALKLLGEDVVYCCADDSHGTAIELKAEELKTSPKKLIAEVLKEHRKDFADFGIGFDSYITTHSEQNQYFSDLIFSRLKDKGYIYIKDVENTYCQHCKRFLPDRYIRGTCPKCGAQDQYGDVCEKCNSSYKSTELIDAKCSICRNPPVLRSSSHYFFRLSIFSEKLRDWLRSNKSLQPETVNYILNWIKEGLKDWDISRDGPYFGFRIPGEENKFYYVWLDAPIGYIASFSAWIGDAQKAEEQWNKARIVHFIGKDIMYFHFLFWPAMLMGAGFSLPESIVVHGFLTVNGEKMSKSRGTFYTAREFLEQYDAESLRFYYARMLSKKLADVNMDFDEFAEVVNNELVANLGNFCYRVLSFIDTHFGGNISEAAKDEEIIKSIEESTKKIKQQYQDANTNEAIKEIMAVSSLGNKYFQEHEPWKLLKEDRKGAEAAVGLCLNIVKDLGILVSPVLPGFSAELQRQMNLKGLGWGDINFSMRQHAIAKPSILVKKIEERKERLSAEGSKFPLDLKVGKILSVEDHPDADKLYVVQVDLGLEKRQLVAGLKGQYAKEKLPGKRIVVVTNLQHAKIRGVESQGMLLAADDGKRVRLLEPQGKEGEQVYVVGAAIERKEIVFEDFKRLRLSVKGKKALFHDKALRTSSGEVFVDSPDGARIR